MVALDSAKRFLSFNLKKLLELALRKKSWFRLFIDVVQGTNKIFGDITDSVSIERLDPTVPLLCLIQDSYAISNVKGQKISIGRRRSIRKQHFHDGQLAHRKPEFLFQSFVSNLRTSLTIVKFF
jgi:hypothetical protein